MSLNFTWIYLFHDPFTDLYKIGKSDNPPARLGQLKSSSTILAAPTNYEFIEAWIAKPEVEKELHEMFAENRVRGEWFNLDWQDRWRLYTHLEKCQRWEEEFTSEVEDLNEHIEWLESEVKRLSGYEQQLEQAKLQGYSPRLLYPAPAINPDRPLHELIADVDGAENAVAVDLYQEIGEDIAF